MEQARLAQMVAHRLVLVHYNARMLPLNSHIIWHEGLLLVIFRASLCSVAMPQHVPQSLPNPPCVECLCIGSNQLIMLSSFLHHNLKSLRAGLGWCVASAPLPSGPNTGSNPGGGRVPKKKYFHYVFHYLILTTI